MTTPIYKCQANNDTHFEEGNFKQIIPFVNKKNFPIAS